MAFHKDPIFAYEKEVRILTYSPFTAYQERLKYVKTELKISPGRNRFVDYIELPLWVDNTSNYLTNPGSPFLDRRQLLPSDDYFTTHPQVKIKDIRFGHQCGLDPHQYMDVKEKIEEQFPFHFGYQIRLDNNLFRC